MRKSSTLCLEVAWNSLENVVWWVCLSFHVLPYPLTLLKAEIKPSRGYRVSIMVVYWERAVTESCKEAGLAEALVCFRLAVPGDKRLRPGWPLWGEVMQDSSSLFSGITWSHASGPTESNGPVGLFVGWDSGFMVDRLTASWLAGKQASIVLKIVANLSFLCFLLLLPSWGQKNI